MIKQTHVLVKEIYGDITHMDKHGRQCLHHYNELVRKYDNLLYTNSLLQEDNTRLKHENEFMLKLINKC